MKRPRRPADTDEPSLRPTRVCCTSTVVLLALLALLAAYLHFLQTLHRSLNATASPHCTLLRTLDRFHTCAPLSEPSHTADCRLGRDTRAAFPALLDRFVVAHLLGWALKAALYPARPALWAASLLFELVERAALPILPTLAECWWDSLLLDLLLCNAVGIEVGRALASSYAHPLGSAAAKRDRPYHDDRPVARHIVVVAAFTVTDLNAFLLKHVLRLRSASYLNVARLAFFALLAPRALRELRQDCHAKQLHHSWRVWWHRCRPAPWTTVYVVLLACELAAVVTVWPVPHHGPT